jgi:hypothetical protein
MDTEETQYKQYDNQYKQYDNGRTGYCKICSSVKKQEINYDCSKAGNSSNRIAKKYGLATSSVLKHRQFHALDYGEFTVSQQPIAYSIPTVGDAPMIGTLRDIFDEAVERLKGIGIDKNDSYFKCLSILGSFAQTILKAMETSLSLTSRRLSLEQGQADPLSRDQIDGINKALASHSLPDGIGEIVAGVLKSINPDGSIDSASRIRAVSAVADIVRPKY